MQHQLATLSVPCPALNPCLLVRGSKERVDRIQELRWTHRTLPEHVKANLSPLELQYFRSYDKLLNKYCRTGGGGVGLDLTADPTPPEDPYVQVRMHRCRVDRRWATLCGRWGRAWRDWAGYP